jgi:para-nitrobenzyl esterase
MRNKAYLDQISSRRLVLRFIVTLTFAVSAVLTCSAQVAHTVQISNGIIQGVANQDTGIRIFKGIPFAEPPVGDLRWKPPQPAKDWQGVRQTIQFGSRCMQHPVFGDMDFRSYGMSEDCLYLNVWTPYRTMGGNVKTKLLPVLLYFYGGGFVAGDSSEPRYDGESLARRGIVVVTTNYRLGLFGFLAHPELTKESPHHASGNYGFLDQAAALQWVVQNIAAFGGDSKHIAIGGESAGSISVAAQMASPLSRDSINAAIGESGSILEGRPVVPLAQAEKTGVEFATGIGATTLTALRAMTTEQLQEATSKDEVGRFPLTVDGYFLTEPPASTYAAGKQAHVPLLVGWNSTEMPFRAFFTGQDPTLDNYQASVRKLYGERADQVLKLYPASTPDEVLDAAADLATDRFIAYSTWKWFDLQTQTGGAPVYRYLFARPRPPMTPEMGNATTGLAGGIVKSTDAKSTEAKSMNAKKAAAPPDRGAIHSAEIEYALGNLATNKVFAWTADDYKVSDLMQDYFANFIKTGDPNSKGLPNWPAVKKNTPVIVMRLDVESRAEPEKHKDRYLFMDTAK